MKALVLTPTALFRLSHFSIGTAWFEQFELPGDEKNIKRVVIDDVVYLIETSLDSDDIPIVIINLQEDGVLRDEKTRSATFERIITTTRSIFTESVTIPTSWRKHQEGSMFSIQAVPQRAAWRQRLHFESRPKGNKDLFAFSKLDAPVNFSDLDLHWDIYDLAKTKLTDAVLADALVSPAQASSSSSRAGIVLTQRLPQGFVQGASLDEWYQSKLTEDQRTFVDKPHDGPVRLRGAAGTGKTLSLVVKFLRDAITAESEGQAAKFGFLTHSFASVDLVNSIGESLDPAGFFTSAKGRVKLEVRTLYDLANKNLNFELDQLIPLSLDGREGRKLQAEIITAVLRDLASSSIAQAQYADLSIDLKEKYTSALQGDRRLLSDIMNEFASVLDAEGIRAGEDKGERYARGTNRPSWLLPLPQEIDRRFILEVHRRYRKQLGEMNTLSVDQMIGDFNSFLDSNRWDRIRDREGYDVLFVDELHLFTSIERQTLHKLIKRRNDDQGRPNRPPIFMAYDLKQSPRDTFANYGEEGQNLFTASTGLQGSDLVKLDRVFRYTPEIAEFLADLDATFPAIDVPSEWDAYSGKPELDSGGVPELTVFSTPVDLFKSVFNQACKIAKSIEGGGRRVAVLCPSEEQFEMYLEAAGGQFAGRHLPITSREPSSELRHAGKRFVYSMPEYVAGLQFDTVFLIHVDAVEALRGTGDGVRRRFISSIYLGSSRAEKVLKISACTERGGKSDVLDMALERGSLVEIRPPVRRTAK